MNHPLDKYAESLLKAANEGPSAMEDWVKDLQKEVGAPDGPELPDSIELEYADGTKETIDTTESIAGQGRLPTFYSFDNPAPQEVIDSWSEGDETDK